MSTKMDNTVLRAAIEKQKYDSKKHELLLYHRTEEILSGIYFLSLSKGSGAYEAYRVYKEHEYNNGAKFLSVFPLGSEGLLQNAQLNFRRLCKKFGVTLINADKRCEDYLKNIHSFLPKDEMLYNALKKDGDIYEFNKYILDVSQSVAILPDESKTVPGKKYFSNCVIPKITAANLMGNESADGSYIDGKEELGPWHLFLSGLSDAELFAAYVYSIFDPTSSTINYLYLYGEGNDGKSSAINAIVNYLNASAFEVLKRVDAQTCNLTTEALKGGSHFGLEAAIGKRILYCPELNENNALSTYANLKAITGGDPVSINRKFLTQVSYRFTSKLMVASNFTPFINSDEAVIRRILAIRASKISAEERLSCELDPKTQKSNVVDELEKHMPALLAYGKWCYSWVKQKDGSLNTDKHRDHIAEILGNSSSSMIYDYKKYFISVDCDGSYGSYELGKNCMDIGEFRLAIKAIHKGKGLNQKEVKGIVRAFCEDEEFNADAGPKYDGLRKTVIDQDGNKKERQYIIAGIILDPRYYLDSKGELQTIHFSSKGLEKEKVVDEFYPMFDLSTDEYEN